MLKHLACSIVDELFPIKFPHFSDNIFRYHVTFVIKDHGNMSSDNCFVKVVGLVTPDGVSVKCNRFYHYYTTYSKRLPRTNSTPTIRRSTLRSFPFLTRSKI